MNTAKSIYHAIIAALTVAVVVSTWQVLHLRKENQQIKSRANNLHAALEDAHSSMESVRDTLGHGGKEIDAASAKMALLVKMMEENAGSANEVAGALVTMAEIIQLQKLIIERSGAATTEEADRLKNMEINYFVSARTAGAYHQRIFRLSEEISAMK